MDTSLPPLASQLLQHPHQAPTHPAATLTDIYTSRHLHPLGKCPLASCTTLWGGSAAAAAAAAAVLAVEGPPACCRHRPGSSQAAELACSGPAVLATVSNTAAARTATAAQAERQGGNWRLAAVLTAVLPTVALAGGAAALAGAPAALPLALLERFCRPSCGLPLLGVDCVPMLAATQRGNPLPLPPIDDL